MTNSRNHPFAGVGPEVRLGRDVIIHPWVNAYGCTIGDETKVVHSSKSRRTPGSASVAKSVRTHLYARA